MGRFYFIGGAAGSGKSAYIYKTLTERAVREPEKRFFLFVPEQNTLKAQQEIIRRSPVHGMLNLDVLSFSLLSYRVMEELGIRSPEILDDVSKSLLMRKAMSDVKEELGVYKGKTESRGFVKQLGSVLTEFAQYNVKSEDLLNAAGKASTPLLAGKLTDLEKILSRFYELLRSGEENRAIPEELPEMLLKNIGRSGILCGAEIVFDGYTGFTPVQLKILESIAEKAGTVSFAVTVTKEELSRKNGHFTDLFWLSRETVKNVTDACTRAGLLHKEDIFPEYEAVYQGPLSIREGIEMKTYALPDPQEEVNFVTSRVAAFAKEEGIRYRKTALAVSDLSLYKEMIRRAFSEASIPFFIDDNAPAAGSPVVEMIRAALLVIRNNYEYEDVITYLRNPYVTGEEERDDLDLFENLCRAAGFRGRKRYSSDLTEENYIPESFLPYLDRMEDYRKKHLETVLSLHEALKAAGTADQKASELLAFLEKVFLSDSVLSGEEQRFLSLSREMLQRTTSLFSGNRMSIPEFSDLIEAGFQEMKAGNVPGTMDMVSVGDLKRSRFDDIDCLFILGANEGLLPQNTQGGGIFTDHERMELMEKDMTLAPDDRHDASIQNFYLYQCMNKPSRRLVITCSLTDREGSPQKPSVLLRGIPFSERPADYGTGIGGALRVFAEDLSAFQNGDRDKKMEKEIASLWKVLSGSQDPLVRERAEDLLLASVKNHLLEELMPETAKALYGNVLTGSVTRFEQFARCPFSHFMNYGLLLKERESFDIEAFDIGRLYHKALDQVFEILKDRGTDLGKITETELSGITSQTVQQVLSGYNGDVMNSSARNRYISSQVRRITEKTLFVLKAQYEAGAFETKGTEYRFTMKDDGFMLTGSIDRLDVLRKGEKSYVRIIDYKSGSKAFDLGLCYEGLELQLSAYMREALSEVGKSGETSPAGMFIYNIKDPVLKYGDTKNAAAFRLNGLMTDDPEILCSIDRNLSGEGAVSGTIPVKVKNGEMKEDAAGSSAMVSPEVFEAVLERNRELMREDAKRILSGEIAALPASVSGNTACEYCRYKETCGFDRKAGFQVRNIQKISKKAVLEELCQK